MSEPTHSKAPSIVDILTPSQQGALVKLAKAATAAAVEVPSVLVQRPVRLGSPDVAFARWEPGDTPSHESRKIVVQVEYVSGIQGLNWLVLEAKGARAIAATIMGESPGSDVPLDELHISALAEAMNQMMGASANTLSSLLDRPVVISPPSVQLQAIRITPAAPYREDAEAGNHAVNLSFPLSFQDDSCSPLESRVLQVFPADLAWQLTQHYLRLRPAAAPGDHQPSSGPAPKGRADATVASALGPWKRLSVTVTVRLGRAVLPLQEALNLTKGSVVPLNVSEGQPPDVLVSDTLVARGEVIVVRERFGVRITEMCRPSLDEGASRQRRA